MHDSSARTMLCPNVSLDLPTHLQAGYEARLHSPQLETHSSYQVLGGRAEVSEKTGLGWCCGDKLYNAKIKATGHCHG